MKYSNYVVAATFGLLISASGIADGAEDKELPIHLRGLVGVGLLSGTDPADVGPAFGAQVDLGINSHFGVGMMVSHSFADKYVSAGAASTEVSHALTAFGLRFFYQVSKGPITASLGPVIGAIAHAYTIKPTGTAPPASGSETRLAVGVGASVDVVLAGPFGVTFAPSFMQSVGGGGKGLTVISIQGGPYLRF